MVYAVLLGESQGPRLGSFIAIYGLEETRALIDKAFLVSGDQLETRATQSVVTRRVEIAPRNL